MTLSIPTDRNTPITDGVVLEFTNHHARKQTDQMTPNFFDDLEYTDGSKGTITDSVVLEFTNHHAGKQTNQMTQNLVYKSRTLILKVAEVK